MEILQLIWACVFSAADCLPKWTWLALCRYTVYSNSVMKLKNIQIEAGRIFTGAMKLVEIDKLYKELWWLKLSENI